MSYEISDRDYDWALTCRAYVEDIEKRVQKRLDKYREEHEQGFEDYSNKIRKLEHELETLERLKAPCRETISLYKEEQRCKLSDEQLKEQWLKDNGAEE